MAQDFHWHRFSVCCHHQGQHSREGIEAACCFPSKLQWMKKLWLKKLFFFCMKKLWWKRLTDWGWCHLWWGNKESLFHQLYLLLSLISLLSRNCLYHITVAVSFSPGQRLPRVPARQTKITCDLSLPAPLTFCIASCTHQHTQALRSAESRQNFKSYVVAAGKHQCFKGS